MCNFGNRLVRERETQLTTDEEATRHARTELEQQRQQHMGLGSGRRRKGAIDFGHIKEVCIRRVKSLLCASSLHFVSMSICVSVYPSLYMSV